MDGCSVLARDGTDSHDVQLAFGMHELQGGVTRRAHMDPERGRKAS